ncbi:MAG: hypothetical protein V7767_11810, partial [Leeuwenhoekiella sp.]
MSHTLQSIQLKSINDLLNFAGPVDGQTIEVLGYHKPGDGGGGTFIWDVNADQPQDGGFIFKNKLINQGRFLRLDKGRIDPLDFGAISGENKEVRPLSERFTTLREAQEMYPFVKSLESSQAYAGIQAAINYAANIADVYCNAVKVELTPGKYRINTSIVVRSQVNIEGYGVLLQGPIDGYERIMSPTKSVKAEDIEGQTGGACFTDEISTNIKNTVGDVRTPSFEGLTLSNFRYGFCSRQFTWSFAEFKDIRFFYVNIGVFAWAAAQGYIFENITGNKINTVFVAAATAFVKPNPLANDKYAGYFCDALRFKGMHGYMSVQDNEAFDKWFEESILRPTAVSVTNKGEHTFYLAEIDDKNLAETAKKVSGRAIYIPQRNNRLTFGPVIEDIQVNNAKRGAILINNAYHASITKVSGEGIFGDINNGPESMIVLGNTNSGVVSAIINNISVPQPFKNNYESVIGIASNFSPSRWNVKVSNITGRVPQKYYKYLDGNISVKFYGQFDIQSSNKLNVSTDVISDTSDPNKYLLTLNTKIDRDYSESSGLSLLRKYTSGALPRPGGKETSVEILYRGAVGYRRSTEAIQGTMKVWVRSLKTGVQDYSEMLVTFGRYMSDNKLQENARNGDNSIVIKKGAAYGASSNIVINNDEYLVKGQDKTRIILTSPLRADYKSGTSVNQISRIDRTLAEFQNNIANISLDKNGLIISKVDDPIEFRVSFEYFGSP